MFRKKNDSWGDEKSPSINKPLVVGGAVAALLYIGYHFLASGITSSDAKLAFIKQDFSGAMSDVNKIEKGGDSFQIQGAMNTKYQILLDKDSGYYNPNVGYNVLKSVFAENNSVNTASTLLELANTLDKPFSDKEMYLKYLAEARVGNYADDLVNLYLSSKDGRVRDRAFGLLEQEHESVQRNVSMAWILINDRGGKDNILQGIDLLSRAGSMGSPSAEAALAIAYLSLISVSPKGKNNMAMRDNFTNALVKSLSMGYTGELLDQAVKVVRDGMYGVPKNMVLVDHINKIRKPLL